jgi:hypothetical protein
MDRMEAAVKQMGPIQLPDGFEGISGPGALPKGVNRERIWPLSAIIKERGMGDLKPLLPDPTGRALIVTLLSQERIEIRSAGEDGVIGAARSTPGADDHARIVKLGDS